MGNFVLNSNWRFLYEVTQVSILYVIMLKVVQLNTGRREAVNQRLMQLVLSQGYDVILIQEPVIKENAIPEVPKRDFDTFMVKESGTEARIRAAIVARKSLYFFLDPLCSETDWVVVKSGNRNIPAFASIYFEGGRLVSDSMLEVVSNITKKHSEIVIGADVNAYSLLWNSKETISNSGGIQWKRGEQVEELLITSSLMIKNSKNHEATYRRTNAESWIDVTLASTSIADRVSNWELTEAGTFGRDHVLG